MNKDTKEVSEPHGYPRRAFQIEATAKCKGPEVELAWHVLEAVRRPM